MRIRTIAIVTFLMLIAPVGGCNTDSQQRIEWLQTAIKTVEQQSTALDAKIIQVESLLAANETLLSDPNATGDTLVKLREENAKLVSTLAAAKPVKVLWDAKLQAYRMQLDQALAGGAIDPNKEAELWGRGITAIGTTAGGQIGVWLTLIGGMVTTFGGGVIGAIARGKKAKKEIRDVQESARDRLNETSDAWSNRVQDQVAKTLTAETAIRGLVESVDALLKSGTEAVTNAGNMNPAIDADKAKNILMRAQAGTPEAIAAVQRIRARQENKSNGDMTSERKV